MKLPELSLLALPGRHSPLLEFFVTLKQAYLFEFAYAEIQNKYFNDRQFYSLSIV